MRSNMNFKGYEDTNNPNSIGNNGSRPPANLLRQPSIYSLTFDEFQSTIGGLGKDFGSMNMDELLKNIWTAEETQSLAMSSSANGGESSKNNITIVNNNNNYYSNPNGNLQKQGSLTLPRTLSQKTVDEVWRDLMRDSSGGNSTKVNSGGVVPSASAMPQRQPTLGEITLEEFLVRAGVVREDNNNVPLQTGRHQWFNNDNAGLMLGFQQPNGNLGNANPMVNSNNPVSKQPPTVSLQVGSGTGTHTQHQQPPLFPKPVNVAFAAAAAAPMHLVNNSQIDGRGGMMGVHQGGGLTVAGSPRSQISPPAEGVTRSKGDPLLQSPVPYVINRPRKCSALEKVVERRQRRMIKNRESAARSRARKQAYTLELEAEVEKLKDLNRELKRKQAKFMEMQKNNSQALVTLNGAGGGKRQCLRRTLTGPW
ncbi:ABSCISIC ACID-INSENSITIVE 5-like protein 7 [Neltuma alba]|uniref:ABSCISIC ACID-INSENSITIVE 5-like protein 7 n=1 Tax=Neltuma alba TaxID=207710 RepID=UPI0010A3ECF5|nr:ABSCISIC ACID-INSENSITIVE 5-like protein 7 [Prosopis alba]